MGFFDRFRKRDKEKVKSPSLLEILNSNGFEISAAELADTIDNLVGKLEYTRVLPEQLWSETAELSVSDSKHLMEYAHLTQDLPEGMCSNIPELIAKGSKYIVCISMHAPRDKDYLKAIMDIAVTYAATSEIASKKELSQYIIRPDDRIGLAEVHGNYEHPINVLFRQNRDIRR